MQSCFSTGYIEPAIPAHSRLPSRWDASRRSAVAPLQRRVCLWVSPESGAMLDVPVARIWPSGTPGAATGFLGGSKGGSGVTLYSLQQFSFALLRLKPKRMHEQLYSDSSTVCKTRGSGKARRGSAQQRACCRSCLRLFTPSKTIIIDAPGKTITWPAIIFPPGGARKSIPLRKKLRNRANRHDQELKLPPEPIQLDADEADAVESSMRDKAPQSWIDGDIRRGNANDIDPCRGRPDSRKVYSCPAE